MLSPGIIDIHAMVQVRVQDFIKSFFYTMPEALFLQQKINETKVNNSNHLL